MDALSRSVRAGDASSKEPDFIQDWPEIFQREIGKFLEKVSGSEVMDDEDDEE